MHRVLIALALCAPAFAQFSSTASHVRPVSSLPATCSVSHGDVVFLTTSTKGVYYCSATNTWTYVANAATSGITSLNTDTTTAQTISTVNDTNVTATITDNGTGGHSIAMGWAGTLAKARLISTTVFNDQTNTYSTGTQDFSSSAHFIPKTGTSLPGTCTVGEVYMKTDATAGQNWYFCTSSNTWTQQLNSGGGSGTVTVVSSGSLTSTALVTGGGTTTLQTPAATATMDTSGNISTPGKITTGAGGSVGGAWAAGQGTATTAPTSSVGFMAPASVTTAFMMKLPVAPTTGFVLNT